MDGSGIDFVEADFGAEAGLQSPEMKYEKSAQEWQKWSEKRDRAPIGPVLVIAGSVLLMILFPWLAETALKAKMLPPSAQEAPPQEAAPGQPSSPSNQPQPNQSFQPPPAQPFSSSSAAQSFQQAPAQSLTPPPAQSFQQPPTQPFQQQLFQQPQAQSYQQPSAAQPLFGNAPVYDARFGKPNR